VCIKGVQMSKKDKLVKSMKNNPKDVDFDDLKKAIYVIRALKAIGEWK
jgi:hypothetical protein